MEIGIATTRVAVDEHLSRDNFSCYDKSFNEVCSLMSRAFFAQNGTELYLILNQLGSLPVMKNHRPRRLSFLELLARSRLQAGDSMYHGRETIALLEIVSFGLSDGIVIFWRR